MDHDLSNIVADATKTLEALPVVTGALAQMQGDLTTGQHKTVLTTVADALTIAAQSAQTLGAQGVIGHHDASNVAAGVGLATQSLGIVGEIEALAQRLKALAASIF